MHDLNDVQLLAEFQDAGHDSFVNKSSPQPVTNKCAALSTDTSHAAIPVLSYADRESTILAAVSAAVPESSGALT